MAANEMSERTRTIITIVVVVAVNLILGGALYYFRGQYTQLVAAHEAKKKEKKALDEYLAQQGPKEKELAELTERFRIQESKLPEQEQETELLAEMQRVAIPGELGEEVVAIPQEVAVGHPGRVPPPAGVAGAPAGLAGSAA